MVSVLLKKQNKLLVANIYQVTHDEKYIEVSVQDLKYQCKWFLLKDFEKEYEFLGLLKDFTEEDIALLG